MAVKNEIHPVLFPIDEKEEARMRRETRYIEWTDEKNLKTKLLLNKDCTRIIFAERETPGVVWDVDPNFQSVTPFLEELQTIIEVVKKNIR